NRSGPVLVFSPDGSRAVVGDSFCLTLLDAETGHRIGDLGNEHWQSEPAVAFSKDGTTIITNHRFSGQFRLWDAATAKPLGDAFKTLPHAPQSMVFAPDDKTVVLIGHNPNDSEDKKAQVYEWKTGKKICEFECRSRVRSFLFTPDSELLAAGADDG